MTRPGGASFFGPSRSIRRARAFCLTEVKAGVREGMFNAFANRIGLRFLEVRLVPFLGLFIATATAVASQAILGT